MKKLFLLLLLPNLVIAENLMLICEGTAAFQLKDFETSYSPDELAVIVGDDFIEWDGKFFSSKPYNYTDENGNSLNESYHKNDKKIIFGRTIFENGEIKINANGEMNRLTGEVSYIYSSKEAEIIKGFIGKCKKSEKAF